MKAPVNIYLPNQTNDVRWLPWNPIIIKIRDSKTGVSGKCHL